MRSARSAPVFVVALVTALNLTIHTAVAAADDPGTLSVEVVDEAGTQLPFRAYVINSAGNPILPAGLTTYSKTNVTIESHILAQGSLSCELRPETYTVRVERGLEWIPEEKTIRIEAKKRQHVKIVLRRWANMNAEGWFSGDTHIHRDPRDVGLAVIAEDLNFGANISYWNDGDAFADAGVERSSSRAIQLSPGQAFFPGGQEIERFANGWGAILFLGDFDPVDLSPRATHPWPSSYAAEARARGAHLDHEKVIWSSVPVSAALGLVDSVGVVHNHYHPRGYLPLSMIRSSIVTPPTNETSPLAGALYTLSLYYQLLNCGLRIGVSGGGASGVMPSPVGFERTYVRLDNGFDPSDWLAGLKAGRSFATNGPLLTLEIEGKTIGDAIQLGQPTQTLRITCTAKSQHPLERIEIIHNGKILVVGRPSASNERECAFDAPLALGAGWIVARCFEPESSTQIYAATSPIYLEYGDSPFVVTESAEFYRDFVQFLIDTANKTRQFPEASESARAMADLIRARDFYASRIP